MDFLKLFLRSLSLLPSLIQGVESLYGARSGAQKKDAALAIVGSSITSPMPSRRNTSRMQTSSPSAWA